MDELDTKFKVELKKDKYTPDGIGFTYTHNGYQWHTVEFRTREEAQKLVDLLQGYLNPQLAAAAQRERELREALAEANKFVKEHQFRTSSDRDGNTECEYCGTIFMHAPDCFTGRLLAEQARLLASADGGRM